MTETHIHIHDSVVQNLGDVTPEPATPSEPVIVIEKKYILRQEKRWFCTKDHEFPDEWAGNDNPWFPDTHNLIDVLQNNSAWKLTYDDDAPLYCPTCVKELLLSNLGIMEVRTVDVEEEVNEE